MKQKTGKGGKHGHSVPKFRIQHKGYTISLCPLCGWAVCAHGYWPVSVSSGFVLNYCTPLIRRITPANLALSPANYAP